MFIGVPPGNHDRILDFSTAVTGNLFFVPTADFLADPPARSAEVSTPGTTEEPPTPTEPPANDGSLGIGSLRGSVSS
jgi:putative iron-dependent peroxidase